MVLNFDFKSAAAQASSVFGWATVAVFFAAGGPHKVAMYVGLFCAWACSSVLVAGLRGRRD